MKLLIAGKIQPHKVLRGGLLGKRLKASGTMALPDCGVAPARWYGGQGSDPYPALLVDVGDLALIPDPLATGGLGSWVPAHLGGGVQGSHDHSQVAAHDD